MPKDNWIERQALQPKCIAVDCHFSNDTDSNFEFVFENRGYVMRQYFGWTPRITIEDYWSEEVLAQADCVDDEMHIPDAVTCAERMMETAHGNRHVKKETVEKIIYKLLTGDIRLQDPTFGDAR